MAAAPSSLQASAAEAESSSKGMVTSNKSDNTNTTTTVTTPPSSTVTSNQTTASSTMVSTSTLPRTTEEGKRLPVAAATSYSPPPQQQQQSSAGCTSIGVLNSTTNAHKEHLLYKMGGKEMLRKVIDLFYTHLTNETCELRSFFQKTNIQMLKWHQYTFLSIAFTNPETISSNNFDIQTTILKRHEHMFEHGLNEHHYDIMMKYLVQTLEEMKIERVYIDEALDVLLPIRFVFQKGSILAKQRQKERIQRDTMIQMTMVVVVGTVVTTMIALGIFHHRYHHSNGRSTR